MNHTEDKRLVLIVDDTTTANLQVVHAMPKDDFRIRVATSGAKWDDR